MTKPKSRRNKPRAKRKLVLEHLSQRELMAADTPFDGSAVLYQIHGHTSQGQLSTIDVGTGEFNSIGSPNGYKINATGYRVTDHYIYGIKVETDELLRLDSKGEVTNLGAIEGLPNKTYYSADFGPDGLLYLWSKDRLFGVNVDTQSVDNEVVLSRVMKSTPDLAYDPITELMYGVEKASGNKRAFVSIDVTNGNVTTINADFTPRRGIYGAMFADATGRVFAANNNGGLYEVDPSTGESTFAGYSPRASTNDGSSPSTAVMNLPPVAINETRGFGVGTSDTALDLTTPSDPEGLSLTIEVTALPNVGTIKLADGTIVQVGDALTVEQISGLLYDAPSSLPAGETGGFSYSVNDGSTTVHATATFDLGGLATLAGQVEILHDNDDEAYAGYAFNNEIILSGVAIDGSSVSASVSTDQYGFFAFDELLPGTYSLTQTQPDVVKENEALTGDLGGTLTENSIADIVVPANNRAVIYDGYLFSEFAPSTISGFTYVDADSNGELGGTESGISAVTLTLTGTDDLGTEVTRSTTTSVFGLYEFTGLRPGTYTVTQHQPIDYIDSAANAGSEDGVVGDNFVSEITLEAGVVATHYDFGELDPTSLIGFVYLDNDFDKLLDGGDAPIPNITVRLTGTDEDGNSVDLTTDTDENGRYSFVDLNPGTYSLEQIDQPVGLVDGVENLGKFRTESEIIERNGVAGEDIFTGIVLQAGDTGIGYNFGETLVYELASEFDVITRVVGDWQDDSFEFIGGTDFHQIIHNGEVTQLDASLRHRVEFVGRGGENSVKITGTEDVESVRLRENSADYHARTFRVTSFHTNDAAVYNGGGFDRLYLYDSEGNDSLRGTQTYALMTGEGFRNIGYGFHRTYSFSSRGGFDTAALTDSKRDDTFRASADNARLFGRDYYNNVRGFDRVVAKAVHGGNDTAIMWDSAADGDVFQSTSTYARMYNTDYYNFTTGFDTVTAYANQGGESDRAYFKDTLGDDILVSTPAETGLSTTEYTHTVRDFERMQAFSTSGSDRAYLYDSKLDDKFRAVPTYATLSNAEYYLKVNNFAQVDAFSSGGGTDRAYFYDSAGDDTFVALEDEARMYGAGFDNTGHGFSRAYAFATQGGTDQAILYDSDLADTLRVSEAFTRMYSPEYYTRAQGFENLDVVFSDLSNQDRALMFGGVSEDTLSSAGSLASHISGNSSSYVYGLDLIAAMEGSDDVSGDIYAAPGEDGDKWDIALKDF